jgi:hypothetical protein
MKKVQVNKVVGPAGTTFYFGNQPIRKTIQTLIHIGSMCFPCSLTVENEQLVVTALVEGYEFTSVFETEEELYCVQFANTLEISLGGITGLKLAQFLNTDFNYEILKENDGIAVLFDFGYDIIIRSNKGFSVYRNGERRSNKSLFVNKNTGIDDFDYELIVKEFGFLCSSTIDCLFHLISCLKWENFDDLVVHI